MTDITLDQAQRALTAAAARATELGVPSSLTVLDSGARLVASIRQDGAPLVSIDSSFAKARTAVFFQAATRDLVPAIQPGAPLYTLRDATAEQLTFLAGGVPVVDTDKRLIGAIGAGGGTPEQDQLVVEAALAAL